MFSRSDVIANALFTRIAAHIIGFISWVALVAGSAQEGSELFGMLFVSDFAPLSVSFLAFVFLFWFSCLSISFVGVVLVSPAILFMRCPCP